MKKAFNLCYIYLKNHKVALVFYICICICNGIISLATPFMSGNFVDFLISRKSVSFLYKYCIFFFAINIVGIFFGYLVSRICTKTKTEISFEFNRDVIIHFHHLPLKRTKEFDVAYINQQISNDINSIVSFCFNFIQNLLINTLSIIIPFLFLLKTNFFLALFLSSLIAIYYALYILFKQKLYKITFNLKEKQSIYFSKLFEQLAYTQFIKNHSLYSSFIARLEYSFTSLLNSALSHQKVSYAFSSADSVLLTFAQIFLFLWGGREVIYGKLTIGYFTIILSYFKTMISAVRFFFNLGQTIQDINVSYDRLNRILKIPEEPNGNIELKHITKIIVKNLHFDYNEKHIINNLSFQFTKGKIYILRGKNGSGKSTFLNILIGNHIGNYSGEILYNDFPLESLNIEDLKSHQISVCEQDPIIFEDTIKNNILLRKNSNNKSRNIDILINKFNLSCLINEFPQKLETVFPPNLNSISGGEKQKICLVRTFIENSDLVVLDEPTLALDDHSVLALEKHLLEIKSNSIILISTHDERLFEIGDMYIDFPIT